MSNAIFLRFFFKKKKLNKENDYRDDFFYF
jgi:hypothetical protein